MRLAIGPLTSDQAFRRTLVLLLALAFDLLFGEPPNRLHPVAWLGTLVGWALRRAPKAGPARQLLWGGALTGEATALAAVAGGWVASVVGRRSGWPAMAGLLVEAAALKCVFSVRGLLAAGVTVERDLRAGVCEQARADLRALVSRDTDDLTEPLIAAATIESLAENATDSFVAPWLAYMAGGLPAAYAYRALNTLDSMVGYRGTYEYLGKAAARLDDLVNLLPARLTALLLALCAPVGRGSTGRALTAARRWHGRTASPNAGWTMAALAGALGVTLEKRGAYVLGDGRLPDAGDIARTRRIVAATALLAAGGLAGALWIRGLQQRASGRD